MGRAVITTGPAPPDMAPEATKRPWKGPGGGLLPSQRLLSEGALHGTFTSPRVAASSFHPVLCPPAPGHLVPTTSLPASGRKKVPALGPRKEAEKQPVPRSPLSAEFRHLPWGPFPRSAEGRRSSGGMPATESTSESLFNFLNCLHGLLLSMIVYESHTKLRAREGR